MGLMKDGVFGIVVGNETAPAEDGSDAAKSPFQRRKDKAIANIVLAIDPALLYILEDNLDDPKVIWDKLAGHFQKKSWSNKLNLHRRLHNLKLEGGESGLEEHSLNLS